jgi:hypothetical protein
MKKLCLPVLVILLSIFWGCSGPSKPITVNFEGKYAAKSWPLKELNNKIPANWSSAGFLTFEFNSSTTQRFTIRLHDGGGYRKLEIVPFQGVWVRASIPLVHFRKMNTEGMDQAAIWKTARPGYWIGFTGEVGPITSIDSIAVSMENPIGTQVLMLRNFRLTNTAEDTVMTSQPLVDEFGQWISDDHPGKAKTEAELQNIWREEEKSLKSETPEISKYGGFKNLQKKATGFFRVEQIDGKWWFVDPDGYLFFSNGSCCIEPWSGLARINGREYIFKALPPDSEDRKKGSDKPGTKITSFYTWNLARRFGSDWYNKWIDLTSERMSSWGINTIGNWSDKGFGQSHRKAYVATLDGWGIESGWMGMADVYAPGFKDMVDKAAAEQCSPLKTDPFLLGYFIGNEPAWPGRETELAQSILDGGDSPMKKALQTFLTAQDTPEKRKEFAWKTFGIFLKTVCEAIRKYDPNHLNLGLRFGNPPDNELITMCKTHFNVFSFNHYGYSVDNDIIRNIYNLTGLPVIIGEFHFGIPRRGMAPGLAQVKDPGERAAAYRYYVENAAANPAVIGTHWFQWIDQPTTGRYDGENYNIGLVDVTDQPYPEMIGATRETFRRLPDIHSGKTAPTDRKALIQ